MLLLLLFLLLQVAKIYAEQLMRTKAKDKVSSSSSSSGSTAAAAEGGGAAASVNALPPPGPSRSEACTLLENRCFTLFAYFFLKHFFFFRFAFMGRVAVTLLVPPCMYLVFFFLSFPLRFFCRLLFCHLFRIMFGIDVDVAFGHFTFCRLINNTAPISRSICGLISTHPLLPKSTCSRFA
jgi:hypothetical protein